MRHRRTTGNCSVTIQTESTYICDSMTGIITIPTQTFYQGEFAESVNRLSPTTTGNSDVTAKTGNSDITGTTTDIVEIPTASPVFLTIASPNNVSRSYCDNVRQPEMALRPLKPEILISVEP